MIGLKSRIRKLERRPAGADYYVVWGRDAEEVEARVSDAKARGILFSGDRLLPLAWSGQDDAPPPRRAALSELSRRDLHMTIEQLAETVRSNPASDREPPPPCAKYMTDAELIAVALQRIVP